MRRHICSLVSLLLCVSALSAVTVAADVTNILHEGTLTESYTLTVPVEMAPGASAQVTLEGTWSGSTIVNVTCANQVTLTNSILASETKVTAVSFEGISQQGSNVDHITTSKEISVASVTGILFGTWSGTFNYTVTLETVPIVTEPWDTNPVTAAEMTTMGLAYYPIDDTSVGIGALAEPPESEAGIVSGYTGSATALSLPSSIDSKRVTEVGIFCFVNKLGLTSVTIPDSVTSIGPGAFYGCSGLISVTIPDGVTSIDESTFQGCTGLTSVTIHDGVKSIGNYAFYGCDGLPSVTIPDSVTSIGKSAFDSCTNLTSVTIPDSVTSIGVTAFKNVPHINYNGSATGSPWGALSMNWDTNPMTTDEVTALGLEYYTMPTGLICLGAADVVPDDTDTYRSGYTGTATELNLPSSIDGKRVVSIGTVAFDCCSGLTSITIPDSVTSIGDFAFCDCEGLTSIIIPGSVTSVGKGAFLDCTSLESAALPNNLLSIEESTFYGCTSLTSMTIPSNVTSIGDGAFLDCISLNSIISNTPSYRVESDRYLIENSTSTLVAFVPFGATSATIPDSITSIGNGAFGYCAGLTSITIPNSITSIGEYAFCDCGGLTSITIPSSVTVIGTNAFFDVPHIYYTGSATGSPWGAKAIN